MDKFSSEDRLLFKMHPTFVVANAIILLTCSGFTSAMPWSVPQGAYIGEAALICEPRQTNIRPEHFEVLSLRHETPLNPGSVTDVQCRDTQA